MVAGQQKKQLNAYSVASCNLQGEFSAEWKKNVELSHSLLSMRAHISLEWDDNQKRVVAKREQIGISQRELGPFINSFSDHPEGLADVVCIPQEIFDLGDVSGVLSYEVWETHLSETERNILIQFLPKGTDAEQVIQVLLAGENFHFGNPFIKWGASLCSGNLHPDAVLHQEQCSKANKTAYYMELQKYHNDIVKNLLKLKERWACCQDPEKDIIEKIWSSSTDTVDNNLSSHANEIKQYDPEENLATTGEYSSLVADQILFDRNKQITLIKDSVGLQERRGFMDRRRTTSVVCSPKEDPQNLYICSGDSAKYMSYFKITRKQHQLVKRIKESGDGIKSKSLNHVLGDIKRFRVHPYRILEEEECKKLHEQWLQLANRDLPSAFANWTKRQWQRQQWRRSLEQEMADMGDEDEKKRSPECSLEDQRNSGVTFHEAAVEIQNYKDEEESAHRTINCRLFQQVSPLNGLPELEPMDRELEGSSEDIFKPESASPILSKFLGNMNPIEGAIELEVPSHSAKESVPYSTKNQLQQIPSQNGHHGSDPMDVELEDGCQDILKPDGAAPVLSKFVGHMNPPEDDVELEGLVPSTKGAWSEVGTLNSSYYHPTPETHGYTSASELSLRQPHPIRERPSLMIDLGTDILDTQAKEALLHRPSMESAFHIDNEGSFFDSYKNQDCNEGLQPFLKRERMLPSQPHNLRELGLQFLVTGDGSPQTGHQSGHFQEQQQQLLEQRQHRSERDLYVNQVLHKNMYSSGGRCSHPGQGLSPEVGMQNWSINPVRASVPLQIYSTSGELLGQNCFPSNSRVSGGNSGVGARSTPVQCFGNGSNADESLYSVLSQFNKLQSRSSYNSMNTAEQDIPARNFLAEVIPSNSGVFPHTAHQPNFLSQREGVDAATLKANNTPWMNLSHQNFSLNDSMGRPFLRSQHQ